MLHRIGRRCNIDFVSPLPCCSICISYPVTHGDVGPVTCLLYQEGQANILKGVSMDIVRQVEFHGGECPPLGPSSFGPVGLAVLLDFVLM